MLNYKMSGRNFCWPAWENMIITITGSSTPSTCTDTLSVSSTDHEERDPAISFLVHTADEVDVMQKMKETFKHRQELVHNSGRSADILNIFPRFLDAKGLVNQDFALLFNAETSNKLLERWETAFKHKVINEAKSLTSTAEILCLLSAAEGQGSENDWDSDMSSILLLVHLLPPSPGRKKTKISPTEAVDRLVHFHKSCTSIETHLSEREGCQLYLLGLGRFKGRIEKFYVVVDTLKPKL
ncbi:uncharacterized protein LOC130566627 isoform X1 [Triplophysa rosa]|uniref:uncharacterized protein LOC130566627 isoform X1 n=1 Tax=Triplophysa rosa TaxID=992332 RepID=UPI002545E7C4|nr:uncharacterized protein LOC130566627 isoform X1 [Triplophysa rosa]XP_057210213.1 uncharacterized protein LOC130566627 isoform X1 [Triplophysa rosa]XP_057210214.1 uncharacterized protein LOC130566627 isoform X1 [Triplophysa rosa]